MIAVSSILTFDIYKIYINPSAQGSTLVKKSHLGIVIWACVCAAGACLWNGIGLDLGWLYDFMGIIIGPAVVPVFYAVTWKKQPWIAMIVAPLAGLASGLTAWLVTASALNDSVISISTTGTIYAQLAGNLTSICIGAIVASVITLIWPDNYDFDGTRSINNANHTHHMSTKRSVSTPEENGNDEVEKDGTITPVEKEEGEIKDAEEEDEDPVQLARAVKIAVIAGVALSAILIFILPIPMFLSHYIFSKGFFTFWIVLGILWAFVGAFITVVLPVWESRHSLVFVGRGILADLSGKRVANRAE